MQAISYIDQITADFTGVVNVRIGMVIVNAGGKPMTEPKWHRMTFDPDANANQQLQSVNIDLVRMGFPAIDAAGDDWARVTAVGDANATPQVLANHAARKAAIAAHDAEMEAKRP